MRKGDDREITNFGAGDGGVGDKLNAQRGDGVTYTCARSPSLGVSALD